jgi:AraC-like DNA-binding protein
MTFYHQQVLIIRDRVFPKEYLCAQVMQAKRFIDHHFASNIVLDDIATEAFYSKFHFLRLFKMVYGKTPHQYLTLVRIEKAKQLLVTGMDISDVCFSVGFDSVSSFKGLFKRHTGVTPSSFQKRSVRSELLQTKFRFLPFFFSLKKSNFQDSGQRNSA